MPFPEAKRVIYAKNPIDRVICQVRFPTILRIESELPASFQERIRPQFPELLQKEEFGLAMPQAFQGGAIPSQVLSRIAPQGMKNYEFKAEDGKLKVNLTRNFLALTSTAYGTWEKFREALQGPVEALQEVYSPGYYERIGLRYVNSIKPSELGLGAHPWSDLLAPHVLGLLSAKGVGEDVVSMEAQYQLQLKNGMGMARMVASLAGQGDERCFTIDTDFFSKGKTDSEEIDAKLSFLHDRAYRLLRWCISELLHETLEPRAL